MPTHQSFAPRSWMPQSLPGSAHLPRSGGMSTPSPHSLWSFCAQQLGRGFDFLCDQIDRARRLRLQIQVFAQGCTRAQFDLGHALANRLQAVHHAHFDRGLGPHIVPVRRRRAEVDLQMFDHGDDLRRREFLAEAQLVAQHVFLAQCPELAQLDQRLAAADEALVGAGRLLVRRVRRWSAPGQVEYEIALGLRHPRPFGGNCKTRQNAKREFKLRRRKLMRRRQIEQQDLLQFGARGGMHFARVGDDRNIVELLQLGERVQAVQRRPVPRTSMPTKRK